MSSMLTLVYTSILAILLLLPALFLCFLLRKLHPDWWWNRVVRVSAYTLCVIAPLSVLVLFVPYDPKYTDLVGAGYLTMLLIVLWEGALILVLPFTAIVRYAIVSGRRSAEPAKPNLERRRFLQTGLAALPVGAMALSGAGVIGSALTARVIKLEARLPNLPHGLEGLRVLHLSDLHLGLFVTLHDLESILTRAQEMNPDLVLVTGDLMDDLRVMPAALNMIRDFRAPLGAWACLGNHEHGNGVSGSLMAYDGHEVRLLNNESATLTRQGSDFTLGGVDDPDGARGGEDTGQFYRRALGEAFTDTPDRFRLLMSHRPMAFYLAPNYNVDLVLAGHTHGGQLGLMGHSHKELRGTHPFPWGFYKREGSRLYTTSGAGQWIPFRFCCPAEAPVIELRSGRGKQTGGEPIQSA
ncbi:MAG: metallophosphoesterase [bacterium]|nr:metallophosphoesterase [bacterium]